MYVAFKAKENPKTRMYIPLELRKRVCILYLESPGSKCTNVFFHKTLKTGDYRKMSKILRNFCTLKTELWVRSQTARCCNFCPPCFESYIQLLRLKIWLLLLKILLRERSKLTVAVLAKRKKEVKSLQFDNSTKKNKKKFFLEMKKMQN